MEIKLIKSYSSKNSEKGEFKIFLLPNFAQTHSVENFPLLKDILFLRLKTTVLKVYEYLFLNIRAESSREPPGVRPLQVNWDETTDLRFDPN